MHLLQLSAGCSGQRDDEDVVPGDKLQESIVSVPELSGGAGTVGHNYTVSVCLTHKNWLLDVHGYPGLGKVPDDGFLAVEQHRNDVEVHFLSEEVLLVQVLHGRSADAFLFDTVDLVGQGGSDRDGARLHLDEVHSAGVF